MTFTARLLAVPTALVSMTAVLLVCASSAIAGTYTVYGCQTPRGSTAPLSGWTQVLDVYPANWSDGCPVAAFMWMSPSTSHGDGRYAQETFVAPPGTTIRRYTLVRAVRLTTSGGYYFQALQDSSGFWNMVDGCETYAHCQSFGDYRSETAPSNTFTHTAGSGTTEVQLKIICGRTGGCPSDRGGVAASVWLFQSSITLVDNSAPQIVGSPSGPLVSGGVLSGVVPVSLGATDQGGGVYQVEIEVDDQVIQRQVLDDSTGTCQPPFVATVPCPLSAAGTVDVNTATLADGSHDLRLLVTDAAGNTATWGPITITTANNPCSPIPAGVGLNLNASFLEHNEKRIRLARYLTTDYARRPPVVGELTTSTGTPVSGAPICVAVRDDYPGAPLRAVNNVSTNGTGGFSYRLWHGPSRTIYFIYRIPGGGAISDTVNVAVRAPVKVHVNSHRLLNGQTMMWHGNLPGPLPPGLLGLMQVWRGWYWQTFSEVHVARSGRWLGRYTFTRTTGVQRYVFRLAVPHQSGYPYAAGVSRRIRVTVTG